MLVYVLTTFSSYERYIYPVLDYISKLSFSPNLTVRDVKHLLVISASHIDLLETHKFELNGAGYRCMIVFLFLIFATTVVIKTV
jgi:hypothetical protein